MNKFFAQFFPDIEIVKQLFIPVTLLIIGAAALTGWIKVKRNIRTPYTRKIFHFIIFSAAGLLQYSYGLHAVTLMGLIVFIIVIIAVVMGQRLWFYQALARETDSPHEKKFILLPLFATAIGGVASNIFFPSTAYIGYFVGGWGDAVGEPVGTRWGRYRFTVPTLFGVRATRSIEGSVAVMLLSIIISFVCLAGLSLNFNHAIIGAIICGIVAAGVEAVSSHGLDNLTIQFCASAILHYYLVWTAAHT